MIEGEQPAQGLRALTGSHFHGLPPSLAKEVIKHVVRSERLTANKLPTERARGRCAHRSKFQRVRASLADTRQVIKIQE